MQKKTQKSHVMNLDNQESYPDSSDEQRHTRKAIELLERQKILQMLDKQGIRKQHQQPKRIYLRWFAAAASVALVTGVLWLFQPTYNRNDLAVAIESVAQNYNPVSRGSNTPQSYLQNGHAAYAASDWQAALSNYKLAVNADSSETAVFYCGVVSFLLKDYPTAINYFNTLTQQNNTFALDAQWLKALALLQSQQNDAALEILTSLSQSENQLMAQQAKKIMSQFAKE